MTTTLSLELPGATSFDLYLCGASLSSAGFPPLGGRMVNTVKGLLKSELDGNVIDESGLTKMKFTNFIFRALIHISSLQTQHIKKIKYHKKDDGSWALRNQTGYPPKLPFGILPIERYWSAGFANSPIPDPYNMQKPDIALFYYKNKLQEKKWADILSFIEHTSSNFAISHDIAVYWGSATKAYLIMQEHCDDLCTHYFDHSGLVISLPTPIHKFPICVTEAIASTALADPQYLGLDPSIHMCITDCQGTHPSLAVGVKGWVVNNHGKTYSIMDVLWKSQGFFCRGTVCYRVRDPTDGKDYVMKDFWVPEAKRYHEVTVLERVNGIPNVVQLMDHWDVMYDGKPDSCHRPLGEPLSDFSSRKELVCAFHDFVVAHRLMVKHGVLHGDLSPNNFIIHEGISYFIDFNHAGFLEAGKACAVSFGTGTIPYISMCVLKMMSRNAETIKKTTDATQLQPIEHYVCNDLESMFYIFFEFVTKYGGAHGILTPIWDKLVMPWSEAYENLGASGLLTTFLSKKGAISEGDFLMDRVSNYFSEFKPLINECRGQIHLTEINAEKTIIHDHILQMLVKFIVQLKDEIPIPIPIPIPLPRSHPQTPQPTAGPSTLPRTGTAWPLTTQLEKAGEAIAALARSRWKGQNDYPELDASDPEENSMAPAQLHQGKKKLLQNLWLQKSYQAKTSFCDTSNYKQQS
ncbi:hypothetical protein EV702DRAFT_1053381 [Suillus placidus]|uniref:Fungal-type protein kinase domain-containing protein n=1 Tax=Suillus placidus TaxID=48579 RepID=A0A9P6ZET1_9AGAM|nr:hypothetical protein EV702DRAFT_1053381 [Suillus placidus]